ncbi:uncharacterized protein LOC128223898 [Mya arenaria]|uniref:uncharacterized protein LOC128223898 n=1 Tax=Mya arenaria TaxID=6604 RepID=UPI0022E8BECC|nr:uncharacterized protein LOC128223898 [Mya arenaria]
MGNKISRQRRDLRSSDEELSLRVCKVLDQLGYSQSMVEHRREVWRETDVIRNRKDRNITWIIAGSKGEGFTAPFESDVDRVRLNNFSVCETQGDEFLTLPDTHFKFIMESNHCHPGHFRLNLTHSGTTAYSNIQQALFVHDHGKIYISSEIYRTTFIEDKTQQTVSGPAITDCDEYSSCDNVNAFRCTSKQQLLSEWMKRPRHHNWPTQELRKVVSEIEAQMVPVGCKSSGNKDIEWRVCFIISEQRLTDSWNKNQYKIYILLKLIKNSQLKPISDEISSYLMKNIMLWFTEQNPAKIFRKKYLLQNVMSCLKMLQDAIKANNLSYYMIPHRNMLTGKINQEQERQLIEKLEKLIKKGPRVILRCPKLCAALQMSPAELAEKGRWRDELEELYLKMEIIWCTYWSPDLKDEEVYQLANRDQRYECLYDKICDMVLPQWRENYESDVMHRKIVDALS